jgi:FkbM family methyltransferase
MNTMTQVMLHRILKGVVPHLRFRGIPHLLWSARRHLTLPDGVYHTADGLTLSIPSNDYFAWMMVWGYYSQDIVTLLSRYLRPGDSYLDVGAHVGYLALVAQRLVGSEGSVVAIDPDPQAFGYLTRNAMLNEAPMRCLQLAIADRAGTIEFGLAPQLGWSTAVRSRHASVDAAAVAVQANTLDAIVEKYHPDGTMPRLVKIDVEGFEPQVLRGARRVLDARKSCWIVEINSSALSANGATADAVVTEFLHRQYRVFWIEPGRHRLWHNRKPRLLPVVDMDDFLGRNGDIIALPPTIPLS